MFSASLSKIGLYRISIRSVSMLSDCVGHDRNQPEQVLKVLGSELRRDNARTHKICIAGARQTLHSLREILRSVHIRPWRYNPLHCGDWRRREWADGLHMT